MRYSNSIAPNGFSNEDLVELYKSYQPVGSGPLGIMRVVCQLIEQLAQERGFELPEPEGLKKEKRRD